MHYIPCVAVYSKGENNSACLPVHGMRTEKTASSNYYYCGAFIRLLENGAMKCQPVRINAKQYERYLYKTGRKYQHDQSPAHRALLHITATPAMGAPVPHPDAAAPCLPLPCKPANYDLYFAHVGRQESDCGKQKSPLRLLRGREN